MRLTGGRTGKRAVVVDRPRADRADAAVQHRDLVRRPGGRARLERLGQVALPAAAGRAAAPIPTSSTSRSSELDDRAGRAHRARRSSAPGYGRAGSPRPTTIPSCSAGRCSRSCTAATSTATGWAAEQASRKLDRYELAHAAEQRFESLSGGQQARFQILLLELSGATLLLLDEPTDNLDLESAEALEDGLDAFEGTVVAVTHDRWFARGFDRFLVFGADGGLRVRRAGLGRGPGRPRPLTVRPAVAVEPQPRAAKTLGRGTPTVTRGRRLADPRRRAPQAQRSADGTKSRLRAPV